MDKIMFNERYGQESAVLAGSKDMTRRVIKGCYKEVKDYHANGEWHFIAETEDGNTVELKPHFEIGERVSIAQSYKEAFHELELLIAGRKADEEQQALYNRYINMPRDVKGWTNKMFVKAEYMPHQILITDIKVERLQDISNEDAMREGVYHYETPPLHHEFDPYAPWPPHVKPYKYNYDNLKYFHEARWAFKHLFNKVVGGAAWIINPWVFVYTFKLVK